MRIKVLTLKTTYKLYDFIFDRCGDCIAGGVVATAGVAGNRVYLVSVLW